MWLFDLFRGERKTLIEVSLGKWLNLGSKGSHCWKSMLMHHETASSCEGPGLGEELKFELQVGPFFSKQGIHYSPFIFQIWEASAVKRHTWVNWLSRSLDYLLRCLPPRNNTIPSNQTLYVFHVFLLFTSIGMNITFSDHNSNIHKHD